MHQKFKGKFQILEEKVLIPLLSPCKDKLSNYNNSETRMKRMIKK